MFAAAILMTLALLDGPDVSKPRQVMPEAAGAIGVCAFWKPGVDHPIAVKLMSSSGDAALDKILLEDFRSTAKPLGNAQPNGWVGVGISTQGAPELSAPDCGALKPPA
jgi:hypothetical protein